MLYGSVLVYRSVCEGPEGFDECYAEFVYRAVTGGEEFFLSTSNGDVFVCDYARWDARQAKTFGDDV